MRRIRHEAEIRDRERIGQGRIAHPDPQEIMSFDQRIGPRLRCPGHRAFAVRIRGTSTGTIEGQPVIRTFDRLSDELPHVQGSESMRATITQRHRRSVRLPKDQNRFVQVGSMKQLAGQNFIAPGRHVPNILDEIHERPRPLIAPVPACLGRLVRST